MRLPERVEHQAFPRAAAIAEVAWSPAGSRDWRGFQARLAAQFARYATLGIDYADSAFAPRLSLSAGPSAGRLRVALTKQAPHGTIRYTLDGSEPTPASTPFVRPFTAAAGAPLRARSFDGVRPLSQTLDATLDARLLRVRTDESLRQCTGKLLLRIEDDAPLEGARASFNVDIVDPCWLWPDADLSRGPRLRAAVGQLPFNFQIGADERAIRRGDARSVDGELEIRVGGCDGEPVALVPLAPAASNPEPTVLPPVSIPARSGRNDLCLRFARPDIDPIWAIQWVELEE
jgi:hexosaminidase